MWKVPLFELNYDEKESQAVAAVLDSQWLTMGEQITRFEQSFSRFLDEDVSSTAVSSCTAALHLALLAADVGAGDEVIIPALTFVADINVVAMTRATPVLVDSESLNNWNVSASQIEASISEKTKAVIVVHFAGYPCGMDEIVALCKSRNLTLIEDVAHAPGASWNNQACGTFGSFGCFSFFSNKNLSIGEGGMIVCPDPELDQQVKYLRSHGMTTLTLDRHKGRAVSYDVIRPGLNYRMDEIRAAIGSVQLDKLTQANQQRQKHVAYYQQLLKANDSILVPFQDFSGESSYHIFPILLDAEIDRICVIEHLKQSGVQSSIHYPSFRSFTAFQGMLNDCSTPVADEISERVLTLPLYPTMKKSQIEYVVQSLKNAIDKTL